MDRGRDHASNDRSSVKVNQPVFWFMMQIGMIVGFVTSYPLNIFLIRAGWKEKMPQYKSEMKSAMREQERRRQLAA